MLSPVSRYVALMEEWHLVIDADSEEECCAKAAEELKRRIKPDQFIVWEDPHAFETPADSASESTK
jgi:hypothetical protein